MILSSLSEEKTKATAIQTPAPRVWKVLRGHAGLWHISDPDVWSVSLFSSIFLLGHYIWHCVPESPPFTEAHINLSVHIHWLAFLGQLYMRVEPATTHTNQCEYPEVSVNTLSTLSGLASVSGYP